MVLGVKSVTFVEAKEVWFVGFLKVICAQSQVLTTDGHLVSIFEIWVTCRVEDNSWVCTLIERHDLNVFEQVPKDQEVGVLALLYDDHDLLRIRSHDYPLNIGLPLT